MSTNYGKLDVQGAVERMGDREIFLEIAHYFAERLPENIQEMESAFARGDMPSLTRLAHSCKSNCAGVGAEEERALCLVLEQAGRAQDVPAAEAALARLKPKLLDLKTVLESIS